MAGNRAIAYMGPRQLEIQNLDYPKLVVPVGNIALIHPVNPLPTQEKAEK